LSGSERRSVEPPLTPARSDPSSQSQSELGTLPRNRLARDRRAGYAHRRRRGGLGPRGLAVMLGAIAIVLIVVVAVLPGLAGGMLRGLAESNPDLVRFPFIADAVAQELADRVDVPAGTDPTPVQFDIAPGTGSRQITDDLVARGLVTDRLAFTYILVTEDVASHLQAGTHTLSRTMTPREVAEALAATPAPSVQTITIALRTGLRIEQVVAYLEDNRDSLAFDPADFLTLARDPPADLVAEFPMLATMPAGRSLEGYLGSGVIQVPTDTTARGLLEILLQRREAELDPYLQAPIPDHLSSFYDVLVLASIVDHEAKLDADRPLIAGVYVNRLAGLANGVRLLNSEPTVVYANDTIKLSELALFSWPSYVFWGLTGYSDLGDLIVPDALASFQTWHSTGLPDWPIASPSIASLQAAFNPDTADGYIFFYAKCDNSGGHWFEKTLAEHQQHVLECSGGGGSSATP
jgi:UPF0755 protein